VTTLKKQTPIIVRLREAISDLLMAIASLTRYRSGFAVTG